MKKLGTHSVKIPHLHQGSSEPEGPKFSFDKATMLVLAVTLHNIPEGMAVRVVHARWLSGDEKITLSGALALALGIAMKPSAAEEDFRSEGLLTGFYRDEDNAQEQCGIFRLLHQLASGNIPNDGDLAAHYHFVIRTKCDGDFSANLDESCFLSRHIY